MLWCAFNSRLNSSTRCELAAAIIAVLGPQPVNIGIDNATVVLKGNEIIQHERRREKEERICTKGRRMFGGTKSRLHRQTPYKQKWALMKDGDSWENFAELVRERGPESVVITKVKGHATQQMVDEGKVEKDEKEGNDQADEAAEAGATKSQGRVQKFAEAYSWRHGQYRKLMARIQQYIVALRKEEKRLKQEDEKEKDPFEKKEGGKVQAQQRLRYAKTGETFKLHMHKIRKEWCEVEKERAHTEKYKG